MTRRLLKSNSPAGGCNRGSPGNRGSPRNRGSPGNRGSPRNKGSLRSYGSAIDTYNARRFIKVPKCPEVYESGRSARRLMKVAEVSGTKSATGI